MPLFATTSNALLATVLLATKLNAEPCELCSRGSMQDPDFELRDGTSCLDLANSAMELYHQYTHECDLVQGLGFQFCGCTTPPPPLEEEACKICPVGSTMSRPDLIIIGMNETCSTVQIMSNLFLGEEACNFLPRLAYYCGCTNVEPECTACPNQVTVFGHLHTLRGASDSCQDAELVASLAPNESACQEFQNMHAESECGCRADAPTMQFTKNPTSFPTSSPTRMNRFTPTIAPSASEAGQPSRLEIKPTFKPTMDTDNIFESTTKPSESPLAPPTNSPFTTESAPGDSPSRSDAPSPSEGTIKPSVGDEKIVSAGVETGLRNGLLQVSLILVIAEMMATI